MNSCSSNPCFNGGVCTNEPDGYHCSCSRAWSGARCEISKLVKVVLVISVVNLISVVNFSFYQLTDSVVIVCLSFKNKSPFLDSPHAIDSALFIFVNFFISSTTFSLCPITF